jgi:hypothetical protein
VVRDVSGGHLVAFDFSLCFPRPQTRERLRHVVMSRTYPYRILHGQSRGQRRHLHRLGIDFFKCSLVLTYRPTLNSETYPKRHFLITKFFRR